MSAISLVLNLGYSLDIAAYAPGSQFFIFVHFLKEKLCYLMKYLMVQQHLHWVVYFPSKKKFQNFATLYCCVGLVLHRLLDVPRSKILDPLRQIIMALYPVALLY